MNTQEITAHALALGITPSAWPEFWTCGRCQTVFGHGKRGAFCNCLAPDMGGHKEFCNLPDPLSDDPRCAIWDGFYMRALGWPHVYVDHAAKIAHRWICDGPWECFFTGATPTAALHAAFLAKGAKG